MAEFKDDNGVCLVCHPHPFTWKDRTGKDRTFYSTELSSGGYTSLSTELWNDELAIVACGDDETCYSPKFCPECGRRLKGRPLAHPISRERFKITYVISGFGLKENFVAFGIRKEG